MSVFHNNALIGAGGGAAAAEAAVATKSLRFNASDTAYLNRTPSSAGNRRTFTFACWFKLVETSGTRRYLFSAASANTGSPYNWILGFAVLNGQLCYTNAANDIYKTDAVLRDFSAWYHCVFAVDTTQATASDRVKIYLNGALMDITDQNHGGADPPSQNTEYPINNTTAHAVGAVWNHQNTDLSGYFNGYIADAYLIDGSALDPTSFGAYDDNGVWQAAAYSGTYGTNGFKLSFDDSSSNAALGTDSSGNDNTFTVNNLSVAPGLATANQGFDVVTYTGTGSTQSISSLNFQSDFVWIKPRNVADHHILYDSVRGVRKQIYTNLTNAEETETQGLSAFTSDGFTLGGNHTVRGATNESGETYVAWCWKAGGSASSNTDGTIQSSVSANDTYGFSVINHTGTGAAGTFGHGLSSAPDWLIFKNREATDNWFVWHSALNSATTGGVLNNTNAFFTNGTNELNSTLPTDSVIHVGNNLATNGSGQEVICYAWTEKSGFSKFGSYTGNGSTDGPTVTLGFKPRFILLRSTSGSRAWCIYDTERDTSSTNDNNLFTNNNSAESSDSSHNITILDNGFKLATTSVNRNGNGETYVYAAFADKPNGADNDSLFDVPTNGDQTDTGAGGEVSGNYCSWNPLFKATGLSANGTATFTNGNLEVAAGGGTWTPAAGTIAVTSGKWYAEFEITSLGGSNHVHVGISPPYNNFSGVTYHSTSQSGHFYGSDGQIWSTGSPTTGHTTSAVGDIIGVALDFTASTVTFTKNGSSIGSVSLNSNITSNGAVFAADLYPTGSVAANWGQRPFAYSAPSNHKALNTASLPTPTIADGSDYFDTLLWTGDGASSTRTITGLSMANAPDWIWAKERNGGSSHALFDAVRGFGTNNVLKTNSSDGEGVSNGGYINSTSTSSITWAQGSSSAEFYDLNGKTYVAWCWDAGSSTVSNTDGSITSSVRASQTSGFSVVSYTGSGSNATVGHGLNAALDFIIIKRRNTTGEWRCWHSALSNTQGIDLNSTSAAFTDDSFNNTIPTNSVFSIKGGVANVNASSSTYLALCFSAVEGYSAFGSYTGNASTDGPFVALSFRPALVIIKCSSTSNAYTNWDINDSARDTFNVADATLAANISDAENAVNIGTQKIDFLSNGFKIRQGTSSSKNLSGATYVWAAWAENPFQANGGLAR